MNEFEWKLLSELMRNSRRSDRELASVIGSSQPTVTRIRRRLEKEGYIKEYTMIPDFSKLGVQFLAFTFVQVGRALTLQDAKKVRKFVRERLKDRPEIFILERGLGLGYQAVIVSFHENHGSYVKLWEWLRQFAFLEMSGNETFFVALDDKVKYRPLTFSSLAEYLLILSRSEKGE